MTLKKVELCALCSKHKPKPKYEIVELAKKHKIRIMLLPVAYPELNPIEMVWSQMKDYIKKRNTKYSLTDVEKYADEFFETFENAKWKDCVDHVKKIEDEYLDAADDIQVNM